MSLQIRNCEIIIKSEGQCLFSYTIRSGHGYECIDSRDSVYAGEYKAVKATTFHPQENFDHFYHLLIQPTLFMLAVG